MADNDSHSMQNDGEHTLLTDSRKSFSVTVFRLALIANIPASVQTLRISAPVLLGHRRANSSNLISRSQFIVRVCIWKIWALLSRSGSPNSTYKQKQLSGYIVCLSPFLQRQLSSSTHILLIQPRRPVVIRMCNRGNCTAAQ